jgi:signal transduction histidine kinase
VTEARGQREIPAASPWSDANLHAILDATTDGIVVVNGDGVICFVNRAAEELFARESRELIGDIFGFPLVAGTTVELDVVRPSIENCVVEMRVASIEWENQPACLAALRDVTERKQAEAERAILMREQVARIEAEAALRSRDEFLASTAHELKTPLTRLRLALQRARRRLGREPEPPPAYVDDALRQIDVESEHVARLVGDLLRLPWIESGSFPARRTPIDLADLVRTSVTKARARAGESRLIVEVPAHPVVVSGDRKLLDQFIASAISNALRASPPGRQVEIDLTTGSDSSEPGAGTAKLSIRDHGTAVPSEDPPRLFGRSFQVYSNAYASGLGLWLYVGREVVRLHNGRLSIDYPPDGGTQVTVIFPAG